MEPHVIKPIFPDNREDPFPFFNIRWRVTFDWEDRAFKCSPQKSWLSVDSETSTLCCEFAHPKGFTCSEFIPCAIQRGLQLIYCRRPFAPLQAVMTHIYFILKLFYPIFQEYIFFQRSRPVCCPCI